MFRNRKPMEEALESAFSNYMKVSSNSSSSSTNVIVAVVVVVSNKHTDALVNWRCD